MSMVEVEATVTKSETIREAELRFQRRYFELWPDAPMTWLTDHLEPLLRLAVPEYDQICRIQESNAVSAKMRHHQGRAVRLNSVNQFIDFYTAPEPVGVATFTQAVRG